MEDLKKNGGSQSEYLSYLSEITEVKKDKEKNQILADSSYTAKTKSIIYKNTTGKEDELYNNILLKDNININEYLQYKLQEFESDKEDDGTLTGKTVRGSKQEKLVNYINSMNITGNQRLLLYAANGYSTTTSQKEQLIKYVNGLDLSGEERMKLYNKFSGFTVYKSGTVRYK